jgi:8-hydroxy-5-deazaflavin:NADPH oxidoreductase
LWKSAADPHHYYRPMATIGILGGTGAQGRGLARRLSRAGHSVVIGSRSVERARAAAESYESDESPAEGNVRGGANDEAAAADLVIVAVPYDGHAELLGSLTEDLKGKIVIDCVNPIGFDAQGPFPLQVRAGSAAQEAQQILPESTVIAAFHHVSAVQLDDPALEAVPGHVLVLGEDRAAVQTVCDLADHVTEAGGIYAGRLRNAGQVEALSANLIAINRRYRTHAGVQITGVR